MTDNIRDTIVAEMRRRSLTRNRVAVMVDGLVSRTQVYGYLDGTRGISARLVQHIMRVLDIEIKARQEKKNAE